MSGRWEFGSCKKLPYLPYHIGPALAVVALLCGLLMPVGVSMAGARPANPAPGAEEISAFTTHVSNLAATLHVIRYDSKELEKIGKDFARTYAVRTMTFLYKQPDKLRLDGSSPVFGDAVLIQNGSLRYYSVPKLRLRNVEDLKDSPGKRMSLLEYGGLIAPETLTFMQAHYVHHEALNEEDTQVYDLTYKGVEGGSHYRVWIEPKSRITVKREWFDKENKLKATFFYLEPHEVSPGVWMPARLEVKNGDGTLAAVTSMEDVQVDQDLKESLFTITR